VTAEETRPTRLREAFYGRVKGKPLKPRQEELLGGLLPKLVLDPLAPAPADLRDLFPAPVDAVRMEIGFGGGEHLLSMIRRFPNTGFIGVEPFVNGMAKLLVGLGETPTDALRLYGDDATRLLDWLPEASLSAVDLFYPDPWHKPKHWKRRFVSAANLDRLARVLRPGATFRFASDIPHYVEWTVKHCADHPAFTLETAPADRATPYEGWPGTRYEAKAIREGRRGAYLVFRRA
jgi:tRNA (guanine-N7-)-methyltransferase